MSEKLAFLKRIKYLILVVLLGTVYFFRAIFLGIYEWVRDKLR
jgi:hypothetical protein